VELAKHLNKCRSNSGGARSNLELHMLEVWLDYVSDTTTCLSVYTVEEKQFIVMKQR
jgi:hypothetical protein